MRQATLSANAIEFARSSFESLISFKRLFKNFKKALEKDQKDLVFNRKSKQEEKEYFNFMKILFTSADKV